MNIPHNELMDKVNKETATFINELLSNLAYYAYNNEKLIIENADNPSSKDSIAFYIALCTLTNNPTMASFFANMGFNRDRIKIKKLDDFDKEKVYNYFSNIYPKYSIIDEYEELTPLEIVKKAFKRYVDNCNLSVFDGMFKISKNTFESKVDYVIEKEKKELYTKMENEIFKDTPIEVVSFLECASKIYCLLKENNKNNELIKSDNDIACVSLLFSVYFYDEYKKDESLSEKEWIQNYLGSCEITYNKLSSVIKNDIGNKISSTKTNMLIVKNQFLKFLDGLDKKDVTVTNVLNNVLKKDKSNSLVLEKILTIILDSKLDLNADFSKVMTDYINNVSENLLKSHLITIYQISDAEAKEYLEYASKVYDLLLGLNNPYLTKKEMIPLSLLVTYNYLKPNFKEFLNSYEITIDKIYNYYGINLDDTAIKNIEVNNNLLINIYDYFFNYDYHKLNIDNLDEALFSNVFINSFLRNISDIPEGNIESLFDNYIVKKEDEEEQALQAHFYKDLNKDTIEFIKMVATYYSNMINNITPKNCTKEDCKFSAIMLAGIHCNDKYVSKLLTENGFNATTFINHFDPGKFWEGNFKYKFIVDELTDNILSGGVERNNINIKKIVKDAFKINISPTMINFLRTMDVTIDYDKFDEKYEEIVEIVNVKERQDEASKKLERYNYNLKCKIINVLKLFEYLTDKYNKKELNEELIKDIDDVKKLALIIGSFISDEKYVRFFEKRNITLENILKYTGLNNECLTYVNNNFADFTLYDEFEYYFQKSDYIAPCIFMDDVNVSEILKNIASKVGANYEYLKVEIEHNMDYEMTLSIDDRIELLKEQEMDDIDYDDIVSILHFGDSLKLHSDYINDELPKLASSDIYDKSMSNLNELISGVCKDKEQERKKGLMALFGKREVKEKTIDITSLKSLKESIDNNIDLLSQEIVGYDAIRRYMEIYHSKNMLYFEKIKGVSNLVREEIEKLDPNNAYQYAKFVQLTSLYQVINDKSNRFNMTCRLIEQQLLRINQATANHFITINALETAKNDLFPLIGTEIAIARGIDSEKDAILVTENVMNLFKALLSRNITEANVNLEMLKGLDLPENYVNALQMDLMQYSAQIESTKMVMPNLELTKTFEELIDSNETKQKQKSLTTNNKTIRNNKKD